MVFALAAAATLRLVGVTVIAQPEAWLSVTV
jgi:hypothetical protein